VRRRGDVEMRRGDVEMRRRVTVTSLKQLSAFLSFRM
jgi:hypothetical protein